MSCTRDGYDASNVVALLRFIFVFHSRVVVTGGDLSRTTIRPEFTQDGRWGRIYAAYLIRVIRGRNMFLQEVTGDHVRSSISKRHPWCRAPGQEVIQDEIAIGHEVPPKFPTAAGV